MELQFAQRHSRAATCLSPTFDKDVLKGAMLMAVVTSYVLTLHDGRPWIFKSPVALCVAPQTQGLA